MLWAVYHGHFEQNLLSYCNTLPIFFSYLQSNGYKPAPLDLSNVHLSNRMMELVELLAENTHNVWAKERIKQGWTYGLTEVKRKVNSAFLLTAWLHHKASQTDIAALKWPQW